MVIETLDALLKFKAFTDDKSNVPDLIGHILKTIGNDVEKVENAYYKDTSFRYIVFKDFSILR